MPNEKIAPYVPDIPDLSDYREIYKRIDKSQFNLDDLFREAGVDVCGSDSVEFSQHAALIYLAYRVKLLEEAIGRLESSPQAPESKP